MNALKFLMDQLNVPHFFSKKNEITISYDEIAKIMEKYAHTKVKKLHKPDVSGSLPSCNKCGMLEHPVLGAVCLDKDCPGRQ